VFFEIIIREGEIYLLQKGNQNMVSYLQEIFKERKK
jgi:hypothetical protein